MYWKHDLVDPGGCGRGDGQTVFWSIEVKRIFAKKGTKKSLEKKASERERLLNGNYALCIMVQINRFPLCALTFVCHI